MQSVLWKKGMVIAIICLFIGASVVPSISGYNSTSGDTIYVDDDSECPGDGTQEWPYCKIQYAIDNASDGDTVYVYTGTYYENVFVDKTINLTGEDKNSTIIDGGGNGDVVHVSADGISISGFSIRNSGGSLEGSSGNAGIEIVTNYNTVSGNNISNNLDGVFLNHAYSNNISGNIIRSNEWDGIYHYYSNNNNISNNTFLNDGISFLCSYQNTVFNNMVNGRPLVYLEKESGEIIDEPGFAGQIILLDCDNIIIQNQEITNSSHGIELFESDNCFILGNNISSNSCNGILLIDSNSNTIFGNNISNNFDGIRLHRFCDNNQISNNSIISNNNFGILLRWSSQNNIIWYNVFINNTKNNAWSQTNCTNNQWDDGSAGNYWSNQWYRYDDNYDNISDIPCFIPLIGVDWFPLMRPSGEQHETIPPDMDVEIPKEGYFHIGDKDPSQQTTTTTIFALPWMNPLTIKVYATDDSGIGEVKVYIDFDYTKPWKDYVKLEPMYPGSDLYTAKLNKWLFGMHNLTFVATDNWGNSANYSMDVFFIYFPRPTILD